MNNRPLPWIIVLLAIALATWFLLSPRNDPATPEALGVAAPFTPPRDAAPRPADAPSSVSRPPPQATSPAPVAATMSSSAYTPEQRGETHNAEARHDLDQVKIMLRDYRSVIGENPVGTNAEIMAAINGGNPRQARLGPPDGQGLNGKGELVDRWGTPYFFHQLDAQHMEIHSAGPDRIMGTADDIVMP